MCADHWYDSHSLGYRLPSTRETGKYSCTFAQFRAHIMFYSELLFSFILSRKHWSDTVFNTFLWFGCTENRIWGILFILKNRIYVKTQCLCLDLSFIKFAKRFLLFLMPRSPVLEWSTWQKSYNSWSWHVHTPPLSKGKFTLFTTAVFLCSLVCLHLKKVNK